MLAGATGDEDAGKVQIDRRPLRPRRDHARTRPPKPGCRACACPGGGCQFLGTAATSQVVGEALGLSSAALGARAVGPADLARHGPPLGAGARRMSNASGITTKHILTDAAIRNAMAVHAAFGGCTNLLLHIPAIAFHAGLRRPTVDDWTASTASVPRLVDALPNGPVGHPTVRVFLAGGVPEVMLHLRELGLLELDALTVDRRDRSATVLDWWEKSRTPQAAARPARDTRRRRSRRRHHDRRTRRTQRGLTSTVTFPRGNLAPEGSRHQEHGDRSERRRCRRRLSQDRPGEGVHHREGRHRGDQGRRRRTRRARRRARALLPRADGQRAWRRSTRSRRALKHLQLGQARRGDHRRPLLRRLHRRVHRPRRRRKRWPAARSASSATATASRSSSTATSSKARVDLVGDATGDHGADVGHGGTGAARAAPGPRRRPGACRTTRASGPRCSTPAAASGAAASTTRRRLWRG